MSAFTSADGSLSDVSGDARHFGLQGPRVELTGTGNIPGSDRRFFTHPAYLSGLGIDSVLTVDQGTDHPALFEKVGRGARHLGRLAHMDAAAVKNLSRSFFERTATSFVIFEDVHLASPVAEIGYPHFAFGYQANWRRELVRGERYVSSRQASGLRRKARKLNEQLGDRTAEFRFQKVRPAHVDVVTELNRKKITAEGGRYRMDPVRYGALKAYLSECGMLASLQIDDRIIAGNIVSITGHRAYVHVVGFDQAFEKFSTGLQLHVATLDHLTELGCTQVDLFWGDRRWKSDVGAVRHGLTTLVVARDVPSLFAPGTGLNALPYARSAFKAWVKRKLGINR